MNGISAIKLPKRPLIAVRPKKAMIVVNEAANTGSAIRFAAVSAANIGGNPRRARKSACSPTTMASSTIMPSVRINANREIMLNVMPATYISAIAVNIAVGIPAATQNAVLAFRNKNNNTTTNNRPVAPFFNSRFRRPEMASARVRISSIVVPCGKVRSSFSASSSTTS